MRMNENEIIAPQDNENQFRQLGERRRELICARLNGRIEE